ncbi:MAG: NUDIX domain-containing protein [Gemmatimonadota bacterium]
MASGGPLEITWERVAREAVYAGHVVSVYRDTVRTAREGAAREAVYDLVEHPGATAVVPLFDDGTVALVHQFRYPVAGVIWEIPAGSLTPGESFAACGVRELAEEVGLAAGHWTPLATVYTTPGFSNEELGIFLAEELTACPATRDADEHLAVERVPFGVALARVAEGTIRDAKTLIGLFAARDHLARAGRLP